MTLQLHLFFFFLSPSLSFKEGSEISHWACKLPLPEHHRASSGEAMKACEQGREMISGVFKMSSLTGNRVNRSGVKLELNTIKRRTGQLFFFLSISPSSIFLSILCLSCGLTVFPYFGQKLLIFALGEPSFLLKVIMIWVGLIWSWG